jgi:hypothetical protein
MLDRLDRYNLVMRIVAAILILAGGVLHLRLDTAWPNDNVERMWLLNFIGSAVIAIALVVWKHWLPVLAGFGLTISTLVMFGLSRDVGVPFTGVGGNNFAESGWNPSPEALLSVIVEIAAAAVLVALVPSVLPGTSAPPAQPVRDSAPPS